MTTRGLGEMILDTLAPILRADTETFQRFAAAFASGNLWLKDS